MTDFLDKFIEEEAATIVEEVAEKVEKVAESPSDYCETDIINLSGIDQIYTERKKTPHVVFDQMDFSIKDVKDRGQFVVLLGPSGCGKSTILRYLAGLQRPTAGSIKIYGKEQTSKDRIGMVFQQYSSLPWRSVLDNVALPLELRNIPSAQRHEMAMEMIKLVGLEGHEHKFAQYPILSGGQLQRVALARSLVTKDKILLLDEPHGALDMKTKLEMDNLLSEIWYKIHEQDPTFLLVTHDIHEAVYLADKVYIMSSNPGKVEEMINIDLPLERNRAVKRMKQFMDYTSYIEDKMMSLKSK